MVPEVLAPVYRIPLVLRRVPGIAAPDRREPGGTPAQPVWTFEAGSPLWAGPTFAGGVVLVGGTDGQVYAVEAGTGRKRWSFRAGGAIRTRPTVSDGAVYVQADDGFLYKLAVASGEERWRVRVVESPIERLPFDNPKSRYDRFGSDVTVAGGRLYLGTHDGKVLALDPESGARVWSFATGDAVLAAPAVDSGRVYVGSFDKHVYALDAASGQLLWKRDTQGAVVSTPAVAGDRVVVGNRAYDVLALDAKTGDVAWKRYVWFSWIESSPVVRDGVAYVGSSDAAGVFAFDVASGSPPLGGRRLRLGLGPAGGDRGTGVRRHLEPGGVPGRPPRGAPRPRSRLRPSRVALRGRGGEVGRVRLPRLDGGGRRARLRLGPRREALRIPAVSPIPNRWK